MSRQNHFTAMDGLRFAAFIPIFLLHAGVSTFFFLPTLWSLSLFFVLSGCLASYGRSKDFDHLQPKLSSYTVKFIHKKLKLFYPLHILGFIATLILLLLGYTHFPVTDICEGVFVAAANLTLIQAWWIEPSIKFSFNGVSWFLSSLMFCFILTPILIKILIRRSFIFLLCILLLSAAFSSLPFVYEKNYNVNLHIINTFPLLRLFEYIVGICLGLMFRLPEASYARKRWGNTIWLNAAEVMTLCAMILALRYGSDIPRGICWLPLIAIFLFILTQEASLLRRILSIPLLTYLGSCVMPLFLIHNVVLKYITACCISLDIHTSVATYSILGALISILLAIVWRMYFSKI